MTVSVSLGNLGRILVFPAPRVILCLRSFITLPRGQLENGGVSSSRYMLLNGASSLRHVVEVFFNTKQPFFYRL